MMIKNTFLIFLFMFSTQLAAEIGDGNEESAILHAELPSNEANLATDAQPCCSSFADDLSFRLSYRGKRGLGYNRGYATAALFYIPCASCCCDTIPILDFRAHRIDDGRFAANAGLGFRKRFGDQIGGLNFFYDYRDSQIDNYNQFGFGAEWFTPCWDFRVNGYFPMGPTVRHKTRTFFYFPGELFAERQLSEHACYWAELEAGTYWNFFSCLNLYTAAGPYYLKSRQRDNAYGIKWRARTLLWDVLSLEVLGTYDHIYKNRVQFFVGIDLPVKNLFSHLCNIWNAGLCSCVCRDKMCEPIYRQEMIVLRRHCFWRTNY